MESKIKNKHTQQDSWWDGPDRFQNVNRNCASQIQNEDLFKFVKAFSPTDLGLHIGGQMKNGINSVNKVQMHPYAVTLNIDNTTSSPDIYARAENLPFKDESIGYVISFHVLEHIKGGPYNALSEWKRVLVPGGIIGLAMPDRRYFTHNNEENPEDGKVAYCEMNPSELIEICNKITGVKVLLFNNRLNNFDFDLILKKEITE